MFQKYFVENKSDLREWKHSDSISHLKKETAENYRENYYCIKVTNIYNLFIEITIKSFCSYKLYLHSKLKVFQIV